MSVTNGSIGARLDRTQGYRSFYMDLLGFDLLFKFLSVFGFFRSPGRKPSPCAVSSGQVDDFAPALLFCAVRSAFRLAWVSFLSFVSGGSSSAVNSSLMFSAVRYPYPFPSALPVPPPVPLPENAADICSHAGVFGNGVPDRICLCRSVGLSLRKKEHIFRYHGLSHPLLQKERLEASCRKLLRTLSCIGGAVLVASGVSKCSEKPSKAVAYASPCSSKDAGVSGDRWENSVCTGMSCLCVLPLTEEGVSRALRRSKSCSVCLAAG